MKKFGLLFIVAILLLTSCGSKPEETSLVSYGLEVFEPGISYDEFVGGYSGADGEAVELIQSRAELYVNERT